MSCPCCRLLRLIFFLTPLLATGVGCGLEAMHSATSQQQGFFLKDAFSQLDAVLQRKRESCELGRTADAELRRSQQASDARACPDRPTNARVPARFAPFSHPTPLAARPPALVQVIQRWLVIFARQHLYAICIKLMEAAVAADAAAAAWVAAEKPHRRRKQLLPSLSKVCKSYTTQCP